MTYTRVAAALAFTVAFTGSAGAAQTQTSFGVSVTVVYNCAMDMSKLTAEQRKVVEDYCRSQNNTQQAKPATQQGGK